MLIYKRANIPSQSVGKVFIDQGERFNFNITIRVIRGVIATFKKNAGVNTAGGNLCEKIRKCDVRAAGMIEKTSVPYNCLQKV